MIRIGIDMSNIFYRSFSIISKTEIDFDIKKEKYQKILVEKNIIDILSLVRKFNNVSEVFLCFDSENYFRKEIDIEYKANRTKKEKEFYDVQDKVLEIFKYNNFNCLKIEGLEADDLLALCSESTEKFTILISNDEDIRQLADHKTVVFTANSLNSKIFHSELNHDLRFINNHEKLFINVDPCFTLFCKLLIGCEGDNIKRIIKSGIGPKTLEKMYKKVILEDLGFEKGLKFFNVEINEDLLQKQFKMVELNSCNMPIELVDKFYNSSFKVLDKSKLYFDKIIF
jgi:5'-3' exonuclease